MGEPHGPSGRFAPHAARELGGMFDQVSDRYDLLNQWMSLGRDRAWRRVLARAIPEDAHAVLDLCTGSGASLAGLRRPGRLVLGVDVSFAMLQLAAAHQRPRGWAARLLCADGFRLPFHDSSLDAVTIAFGARNLRPLGDALAEIGRVLRAGGALAVLEATAPAGGPMARFQALYLRRVVPFLGRLSRDPSAYAYLSRSIFEFGAGPQFERELAHAGFVLLDRRVFLLGAARLWVARRGGAAGQIASVAPPAVQDARPGARAPRPLKTGEGEVAQEWRLWSRAQAGLSFILALALAYGSWLFAKSSDAMPLASWLRHVGWALGGLAAVAFAVRAALLILRGDEPPRGS